MTRLKALIAMLAAGLSAGIFEELGWTGFSFAGTSRRYFLSSLAAEPRRSPPERRSTKPNC